MNQTTTKHISLTTVSTGNPRCDGRVLQQLMTKNRYCRSKGGAWIIIAMMSACLSGTCPLIAQEPELSNKELNAQKLFIEASREKLLGLYDKAASLYEEVLRLDPQNDAAHYELSRVHQSMKQHDKALDHIDKAIRLSPDNTWYSVMKGDILESMEEYAAAIDVYEHLTRTDPRQSYYYQHLTALLRKTNQPEKAVEALNRHEQVAGVLPDLIYEKADLLNALGKPVEAAEELKKLADLYPYDLAHLHRAAAQFMQAGNATQAQQYYKRILELDPEDAKANIAMASERRDSGDTTAYLRSIAPLLSNPAIALDAKILELIPYVERYTADTSVSYAGELRSILKRIVDQYPREAKAHAIYADYLLSAGDLQLAREEYETTLALDKSVFAVWEQLLYCKLEQGDMDGVLYTAGQALDVFPNQASLYYLQGVAFATKNDPPTAIASLQQALLMSGRNTNLQYDVLRLLGSVYYTSSQYDKAFDAWSKAVKLRPDDPALLTEYAYALVSRNMSTDQAASMAHRALELSSHQGDAEHTLALIAFRRGDLKEARMRIEQALASGGRTHLQALELYGDILFSQGETEQAVEAWQRALAEGNTSDLLRKKITERKIPH